MRREQTSFICKMYKPQISEVIIAFSLANLLFVRSWRKLIYPTGEAYHIKLEPFSYDYLAIVLNVLITATVLLLGFWGVRHFWAEKTSFIVKLMFLLTLFIALNGIRQQIYEVFPSSFNYLNLGLLATISVIGVFSLFKWQNYFFDVAKWFCLIVSPFLLLIFWGIWNSFTVQPNVDTPIKTQLTNIQPKEKPAIKNRVVWIIFDELDFAVPFEKKPVALPEFERLKQTSLFATNAVPPAYSTRDATTSLITGRQVKESNAISRNDLQLKFIDGESKFSEAPNIFRNVKSLNGETALVGWVNPYCRVIGQDLSACQWHSFDTVNDYLPNSLSYSILRNFRNLLVSIPFGARFDRLIDEKLSPIIKDKGYAPRHLEMIDATREIIANPNVDLAFIHLPFPHPPNYYNAKDGDFDGAAMNKQTSSKNTYLDNLILTDKVLGEIRKTLEDNGLWDETTLIVSSDHQWRINVYKDELSEKELQLTDAKEDVRVPFFLKLKGQKESIIYETRFNTAITSDLLLAIIKGEVSNLETVRPWLTR